MPGHWGVGATAHFAHVRREGPGGHTLGVPTVLRTDSPDAWLEIWARPGRLPASLARPPLVSSWWMAVGFPPGPAPKEDRVVATGMVRTRVLVPVVMAPRLCMGVGDFTLVA